ncbi:MAG TPA: hypothetical protein DCW42_09740 [Bacteroidetes bacterium]|nr:hypothetical protein [Bacteroidota bacterium]
MKKVILSLLFLLSQVSYGQWEWCNNALSENSDGLSIKSIQINKQQIIVGTDSGVYISTDNGKSWYPKNSGLTNNRIQTIEVNENNIFVGTDSTGGIFLSTNNGDSWLQKNGGIPDLGIIDYYIPLDFAIIGNKILVAISYSGVFMSTNNGDSWSRRNTGLLENDWVSCFLVKGDSIFAGSQAGNVYLSLDSGNSWIWKSHMDDMIQSMTLCNNNIYAGMFYSGVYKSTDQGNSFAPCNSGLEPPPDQHIFVYSLAALNGNIFAGTANSLYMSSDDGNSWSHKSNGITFSNVYALCTDGNKIVAGTGRGGVYISFNMGNSWYSDISSQYIESLAIIGNRIFAVIPLFGVFMSDDRGDSWYSNLTDLSDCIYSNIVSSGDMVCVGKSGSDGGVLFSFDDGDTWVQKNSGLNEPINVNTLGIHKNNIYAANEDGLYKSTNYGTEWNLLDYDVTSNPIYCFFSDWNNFFAGTFKKGIFASTDDGNNWFRKDTNTDLEDAWVSSFCKQGNNIFVSTEDHSVLLSTNEGISWIPCGSGIYSFGINCLWCIEDVLFAGTTYRSVYISTNSGKNWISKDIGFGNPSVNCFTSIDDIIFAGTSSGVFRAKLSDLTTDVKEFEPASSNSIYPNPAHDFINTADYLGWEYQMYDLLGNNVQTGLVNSENINISKLSAGFYSIRFFKEGKQEVKKLIKV